MRFIKTRGVPSSGIDLVRRVDPDRLARKLPERQQYLDNNPDAASALLHHEAGLLQELVSGAAFEQKRSMVIDGSLSDCGVCLAAPD